MPKVTAIKLIEFLNNLGVQGVEVVDNDTDVDFNPEEGLKTVDIARRKILEPQIIQEQSEKIKGEIAGKNAGTFRSLLVRNFGIDRKELDNLNDEEMLKKALSHHDGKYSKDTEDLRKEIQDMVEKHNGNLSKVKEEYEGKLTEAQQKYIDRDIDEVLLNALKDAPLPKNANRLALAKQFKEELRKDVHIHYDEKTKEIQLRDKSNVEMPVYTDDKKTAFLKPIDKAKDYFSNLGIWETNTSNVNPADALAKVKLQEYNNGKQSANATLSPAEQKSAAMLSYIDKTTTP